VRGRWSELRISRPRPPARVAGQQRRTVRQTPRVRLLRGPGPRELALFAGLYALYDGARWIFAGRPATARRHAWWVIQLEHHLGIAVESDVQHALGAPVPSFVLSNIYLAAQLLVLPGVLLWLYRHSRHVYRGLRNTIAGAWLISIPVFALFPVAPPRLVQRGITDTVSHQAGLVLTGHSTMFYNPYAAVPSLHVGVAFAIGISLCCALRASWARALALAWGPLVSLAVVATGNHYIFDTATGLLTTAVAYAISRSWTKVARRTNRESPRPQLRVVPEPLRS